MILQGKVQAEERARIAWLDAANWSENCNEHRYDRCGSEMASCVVSVVHTAMFIASNFIFLGEERCGRYIRYRHDVQNDRWMCPL
jgi:hypothetical protein